MVGVVSECLAYYAVLGAGLLAQPSPTILKEAQLDLEKKEETQGNLTTQT